MFGNLSSPKSGHTTGGSGRGARLGGEAGPGRDADEQFDPQTSKKRLLNVYPEARTSEILLKPMGRYNERLTTGLFAVSWRDEERSLVPAADQRTDAILSLKTFFMHGMSGNFRRKTAHNITFNVEPVNGDLEAVVDKLGEVQKEVREPAGRKAADQRTETAVTRRQMPRVDIQRR